MPARRPSPFPFAGRPQSSEPPRGLDVEIKLIVLVPLLRFVRPDVVVSITGVARILSREPLACVDPARKPLASVDSARDPLVYTILDRGEYPRHGLDEDDADTARDVGAVPPRDVVVGKVGQLRRQFNSLTHRKHRNQKLSYFGAGLRSRDIAVTSGRAACQATRSGSLVDLGGLPVPLMAQRGRLLEVAEQPRAELRRVLRLLQEEAVLPHPRYRTCWAVTPPPR